MSINRTEGTDAPEQGNQLLWKIICVVLALTIAAVFIFAILPGFVGSRTEPEAVPVEEGLSGSTWLDDYMRECTGLPGIDFADESALSCGTESGIILYTYASEKSVDELREMFKEQLGAEEYDRNDETALHLRAELEQGTLTVSNSFSQICSVLRLNLRLSPEEQARLSQKLNEIFPEEELAAVKELEELNGRETFGCSVRYIYDDMNGYLQKNLPIYSRACAGTAEEWEELSEALHAGYENVILDSSADVCYIETENGVLGLGKAESSDGQALITVLFQPGK